MIGWGSSCDSCSMTGADGAAAAGRARYFASDSPGSTISSSVLDPCEAGGRGPLSGRRLSKRPGPPRSPRLSNPRSALTGAVIAIVSPRGSCRAIRCRADRPEAKRISMAEDCVRLVGPAGPAGPERPPRRRPPRRPKRPRPPRSPPRSPPLSPPRSPSLRLKFWLPRLSRGPRSLRGGYFCVGL